MGTIFLGSLLALGLIASPAAALSILEPTKDVNGNALGSYGSSGQQSNALMGCVVVVAGGPNWWLTASSATGGGTVHVPDLALHAVTVDQLPIPVGVSCWNRYGYGPGADYQLTLQPVLAAPPPAGP